MPTSNRPRVATLGVVKAATHTEVEDYEMLESVR